MLIFLSGLNWLIVFSGTIIATVYFFIGLAALWMDLAARTVSCLSYAALATATAHCRELHGFRLDRAGNEIPNGRTGADRHGAGVLAWVEDMV